MSPLDRNGPFYSGNLLNSFNYIGNDILGWKFPLLMQVIYLIVAFFIGDYVVSTVGGADAAAAWKDVSWIIKVFVYMLSPYLVVAAGVIALLLSVFGLTPLI